MLRRTALGLLAGAAALSLPPRIARAQPATGVVEPVQLAGHALASGAFALQSSELALRKATRPEAKAFAGFEIVEQRTMLEALRVAGLQPPDPVALDAEKAQILGQLRGLEGAAFDRAYIATQASGHGELLQLHQALARRAPQPAQRALSTLATAAIQQHMMMLQEMGG